MLPAISPSLSLIGQFLLLLGLGFFFGLAFEEFHAAEPLPRPGGVRTFPLLALSGAILYRLDPQGLLPVSAGLAVLGVWLAIYYRHHLIETEATAGGRRDAGLVVPVCNLLAYLLGPATLLGPGWIAVGATVGVVLLLTGREKLHGFARRIELGEILTAAKFLALTGLVMPLLPDQPVTPYTHITPRQVWLAVLAVCSLSYASYLLRRTLAKTGIGLLTAVLGGLYSSTATTIVMARRAAAGDAARAEAETGIILATAVMYGRLLAIVAVFDRSLAAGLAPSLLALAGLGLALAGLVWRRTAPSAPAAAPPPAAPSNPLELSAALVFAVLFVAIAVASTWARAEFGTAGIYALAGLVGAADIDPFVLSLAEGGAAPLPPGVAAAAVLIAAASNNLLKAAYTVAFAGIGPGAVPATVLAALAMASLGAALWTAGI